MAKEQTQSRQRLHRRLRSNLRAFRPAAAAIVLHLARCPRCRGIASRFIDFDRPISRGDSPGGLAAVERDIFLDLTRGGFLFSLVEAELSAQDDLPPTELRGFLLTLSHEQIELIRHLLECEPCRNTAARILAPQDRRPAPSPQVSSLSLATVLS